MADSKRSPKYRQQHAEGEAAIPERFAVTLFDAMVLYYNVMRANETNGWANGDKTLDAFVKEAKLKAIQIPRQDLEDMLHACVMNDEQGPEAFWHPLKKPLRSFVTSLMRHQSTGAFFYNTYFNFFTEYRARRGLPNIIALDEEQLELDLEPNKEQ